MATLVQTATRVSNIGSTSGSISLSAPLTVGNIVVLAVFNNAGFLSPTVTDDGGNTYTAINSSGVRTSGGQQDTCRVYYAKLTNAASSLSVDNHVAGAGLGGLCASEFSGLNDLDVSQSGSSTGGVLSVSITTTADSDLIYAATASGGGTTAPSGYTVLDSQASVSFACAAGDYYIADAGTAGLNTLSFGSGFDAAVVAAFTAAVTHIPGTASPSGVSMTIAQNTPTASGAGKASPAGVSMTIAQNAPTASGGGTASPSGVSMVSQVGTATVRGGASVIPAGVSMTIAQNAPTASGGGTASPAGVRMTSQVGTAFATVTVILPSAMLISRFAASNKMNISGVVTANGMSLARISTSESLSIRKIS